MFRPSRFAGRFVAIPEGRRRLAGATLFLFTTIFILEVSLAVADRLIDASKSTDVGAGVLLQSGVIWELSWEALLKSTVPLSLALLGTGWIVSRLCGNGHSEQAWFRDIFPYVLWRSVALTVIITVFVAAGILLLAFLSTFVVKDPIFQFLILGVLIILAVPLIVLLTLRQLAPFITMLRGGNSDFSKMRARSFLYRFATFGSLIIPIWWSYVALSPAAAKVAVSPDNSVALADDMTQVSVTINMRNFSSHPLAATRTGTVLQWWDDENPVTESSFIIRRRVPNGRVVLQLPAETKLEQGFKELTYLGDVSKAYLTPRSFSDFDFMGGPEVQSPTAAEYDATRKSFALILNGYRKGRIEVAFEVITEGGKTSKRTITLPRSEGR